MRMVYWQQYIVHAAIIYYIIDLTNGRTHTHAHARTQTHTHTLAYTHTHTLRHTKWVVTTLDHTHSHTQTHISTSTHTHTHTLIVSNPICLVWDNEMYLLTSEAHQMDIAAHTHTHTQTHKHTPRIHSDTYSPPHTDTRHTYSSSPLVPKAIINSIVIPI